MLREDIEDLQTRVRRAKAEMAALKQGAQPMAGDSWLFYRGISPNTWDIALTGITSPSYIAMYKLTMDVEDPSRGFANMFYDMDYDTLENMFMDVTPVHDDPYSWWIRVQHVNYNSDPGSLRVKFYMFAPQRGTIQVVSV